MAYEITRVRPIWAEDATHQHVELVGYESSHTPGEPVMVPVDRIASKMALGETFVVRVDGERVEVSVGKCELCGYKPDLRTAKDTKDRRPLLELPSI